MRVMRYGLVLLAGLLSAGCSLCNPETQDCSLTTVCCTPPLKLLCSLEQTPSAERKVTLSLTFEGGDEPFAYTVKWGHGDAERGSQALHGTIHLEHTFPESRQYAVDVTATDSQDRTAGCVASYTPTVPGG